MNRRKEPCRNFQRGSCQYGDRCKFLHATQQQPKPNPFGFGAQSTSQFSNTSQQQKPNPFGFGAQSTSQFPNTSQQQKPNPFGFGVQNNSQLQASTEFGASYQSPVKPFENKWTRSSTTAAANSTPFKQPDTKPQTANHKCTDPESCKQQIVEDFKNEAPLWKLTCYGHLKNGPCDIVGDISYEELRAAAYEDARRGLNLQSLIERESNLLKSKLIEFDNLLRNPYVIRNSKPPGTNMLMEADHRTSSMGTQSNALPSFSSFSQLGASTNLGSNTRPHAPGNPPSTVFGQPNMPQTNNQSSGGLQMKFGSAGQFGSQLVQPSGSSTAPNALNFPKSVMASSSNQFSSPLVLPQIPSNQNLSPSFLDGHRVVSDTLHQAPVLDKQEGSPDDSIWLKEWAIGEIPEEAPPERFCV